MAEIRHISDTARLAAMYRALESERPDAHFHDPFARRLAGAPGDAMHAAVPRSDRHSWAWITRTVLFDRLITAEIANGADTVINLAAGLDARPYRMPLPASLRWIEVDLPDLIAYKAGVLKDDTPVCRLERVALDLADTGRRRELFARVGSEARRALVITEGILIYLAAEEVGVLAEDLAATPHLERWITELTSPELMRMLQRQQFGGQLKEAGAPFKFAPAEGPAFFTRHGWRPLEVRSMLKSAAPLGRLPFMLRLFSHLPEPKDGPPRRPWSAVCLLGKAGA